MTAIFPDPVSYSPPLLYFPGNISNNELFAIDLP